MVLNVEKWFKAIQIRRSRRTYLAKEIEVDLKNSLHKTIQELNLLYVGVKALYVDESPDPVFVGAVGPYGKITGTMAYFALIIDNKLPFQNEKAGYIGQALVLEAASLGLSTCWVGGFFNREVAKTHVGAKDTETVVAIIPVGYARKNLSFTEKMMHHVGDYHKRKALDEIVAGLPIEKWPQWIDSVIKAASYAPSAYNRQPVQFLIDENRQSISLVIEHPDEQTNVSKEIDRGITMLHMDVAAKYHNMNYNWIFDEQTNAVVFQRMIET